MINLLRRENENYLLQRRIISIFGITNKDYESSLFCVEYIPKKSYEVENWGSFSSKH